MFYWWVSWNEGLRFNILIWLVSQLEHAYNVFTILCLHSGEVLLQQANETRGIYVLWLNLIFLLQNIEYFLKCKSISCNKPDTVNFIFKWFIQYKLCENITDWSTYIKPKLIPERKWLPRIDKWMPMPGEKALQYRILQALI